MCTDSDEKVFLGEILAEEHSEKEKSKSDNEETPRIIIRGVGGTSHTSKTLYSLFKERMINLENGKDVENIDKQICGIFSPAIENFLSKTVGYRNDYKVSCKISDEKICFDIHIASSYGRDTNQNVDIEVSSDYTIDSIVIDTIHQCYNDYRLMENDIFFLNRNLNDTRTRINSVIDKLTHIEHILNINDTAQQKTEYKYYLNSRPIHPDTVPKGFIWFDEDDTGGKYGAIYYDRQLSDMEISEYELEPMIIKKNQYHPTKNNKIRLWSEFCKIFRR